MLFRKKCGIDLGSDTIKIADKKNKKVVCEKNMIAVRDKTYVIAVGQRAYEMYEKKFTASAMTRQLEELYVKSYVKHVEK